MKTWGEMRSEIESEYNIEGEDFAQPEDLIVWANEGKDQAEAEIVNLYDKYLETFGYLTLVQGEREISLPADIYANKITAIWYVSENEKYEIKLIKRKDILYNISEGDRYGYTIKNSSENGIKLILHPKARESSTDHVEIHYIRESKALTDDDSLMDIPLADAFVKQYVKDKIKEKEIGPMNVQGESPALTRERELLIEALNHMIPSDSADQIDLDVSIYEDHDIGWENY